MAKASNNVCLGNFLVFFLLISYSPLHFDEWYSLNEHGDYNPHGSFA
jgi:hypothetical protein